MADWSLLPKELLDLIAKHLASDTDTLRFRSVCTQWRTAHLPARPRIPILPNSGISETTLGLYLSRRTIYKLDGPGAGGGTGGDTVTRGDGTGGGTVTRTGNGGGGDFRSWVVKVEKTNKGFVTVLGTLSGSVTVAVPEQFPKRLDLYRVRVRELGVEYALQYLNYRHSANSVRDSCTLYMEKVAVCESARAELSPAGAGPSKPSGFVILTIHVSGRLALLKSGDKKWRVIDDLPSPYDDVIFYDGEFYAVDNNGRTVVVVLGDGKDAPRVKVVANSVFGGDKKAFVESGGELLLLDKHLTSPEDFMGEGMGENFNMLEDLECLICEKTIKIDVYRLDRGEGKWIEVKDLGDRILFLGENSSFSALASDFPGLKGNCILFSMGESKDEDDDVTKSFNIGVFDLGTGKIGPIADYPDYLEIFWPPPQWLSSNPAELEAGLNQLSV